MLTSLDTVIQNLESGSRPKGGVKNGTVGIPSLGAEHLDNTGGFKFGKIKYIPESFFQSQKKGIIEKNDILIVKDGATTGKVSFVGNDFPHEKASINEHLFKITVDKDKVIPKYVFWHLFSGVGLKQVLKDFRGATVGGISRGFVENVLFPIPSLNEQRKIVDHIDQADNLRQKRKESFNLLNEYLKSIYLEMFGDPVTNLHKWEVVKLEDLLSNIDSGWSPKCHEIEASEDNWGVLKLSAITSCDYNENQNKQLPDSLQPKPGIEVKKGDVLFSRKNTYDLIAATAFVFRTKPKLMLSDLIFRLKIKNDSVIRPEFLWKTLTHPGKRKEIQKLAGGASGSMPNISKEKLKNIYVIVPPIDLQNKFAQIVNDTETLKEKMYEQSDQLDKQFQALMQKSFTGN